MATFGHDYLNHHTSCQVSAFVPKRRDRDVLYDSFKSETTLHGLWSMAAARGDLKKIFWRVVILAAFGGAIYQVTAIWLEYFRYDVIVSKTFMYQRQTVFPAVTFCNMNPVKRTAMINNEHLTSQLSRRRRMTQLSQPDEIPSQQHEDIHHQYQSFNGNDPFSPERGKEKTEAILSRRKRQACTSAIYYNALTKSYYCYYFYSTSKVVRALADSHCQNNRDSLPHVDSNATWQFIVNSFPSPPSGSSGYFWLDIQWPVTVTGWVYDDLTNLTYNRWGTYSGVTDLFAGQSLTSPYLWGGDASMSIGPAFELCQQNLNDTVPSGVNYGQCNTSVLYDSSAKKYYCFFFYSNQLATRGATKAHCTSVGAWLPHINSSTIYNFITSNVPTLYVSYNYFWTDMTYSGGWVYDDGTATPTWNAWGSKLSSDLYAAQRTNGLFKWYGDASNYITVATQLCQREVFMTTIGPSTKPTTTVMQTTTTPAATTAPLITTQPTTASQTTLSPTTTVQITSNPPTTTLPTTASPTTASQTTTLSTTVSQTTTSPTTASSTTDSQTTISPTTASLTTDSQTTISPTTVSQTTALPTTASSTTDSQTTTSPTTASLTTDSQITAPSTTASQTPVATTPPTTPSLTTSTTNSTPSATLETTNVTNAFDSTLLAGLSTKLSTAAEFVTTFNPMATTENLKSTQQAAHISTLKSTSNHLESNDSITTIYLSSASISTENSKGTESTAQPRSITYSTNQPEDTMLATAGIENSSVSYATLYHAWSTTSAKITMSTVNNETTSSPVTPIAADPSFSPLIFETPTTAKSPLISSSSTLKLTSKSVTTATTEKRTAVTTTTPATDASPPTNAPLPGSNIPGRTAQNQQTQAAQHLTQTLANMSLTEKQYLGYQATDFLLDCQYAGYNCDTDDFTEFYNNIHGNCFTFNSGWNETLPVLNTSRIGSRFALKVTINIDQDDYIEAGNEAAGARIVIHDQADMPYPEDVGILAKAGMLTSMHVSRTETHRLSAPYSNCIKAENAATDMDVYTELYPVDYDHIGCYKTCFQRHMIQKCGCADASLPNAGGALYNGSYPVCDLTNMIQNDCNYNVTQQFVQNTLLCNCPIACNQVQYPAYVTQSYWPTNVDKSGILQQLAHKIPNIVSHQTNDPTKYKRNLLKVEIYFDNFNLVIVEETAAYPMETVWSNLGGGLGVLLGAAFMSIFETLDLAMDYAQFAVFLAFFSDKIHIGKSWIKNATKQ